MNVKYVLLLGVLCCGSTLLFGQALFAPARPLIDGQKIEHWTLADADSDGDLDVLSSTLTPHHPGDSIWLYKNDGTGNLDPPVGIIDAVLGIQRLKLADLDMDGNMELLVIAVDGIHFAQHLGATGYGGLTDIATGSVYRDAAVGDVNGDSWPDIVYKTTNDIVFRRALGSGAFDAPVVLTSTWARQLTVTDLDGDSYADILYADGADLRMLQGSASGPAAPSVLVATLPFEPGRMTLADQDNDGDLDILIEPQEDSGPIRKLGWFENLSSSSLGIYRDWGVGLAPTDNPSDWASFSDPESDGILGLLIPSPDGLLYRKAVGLAFEDTLLFSGDFTTSLAGDLDGNGLEDIMTQGPHAGQSFDLTSALQTAPLNYATVGQTPFIVPGNRYAFADLDGDGFEDILSPSGYHSTGGAWYRNAGGTIESGLLLDIPHSAGYAFADDWNSDGILDVLTVERHQMLSDGTFNWNVYDTLHPYETGAVRVESEKTDLDADGDDDLLVVLQRTVLPIFVYYDVFALRNTPGGLDDSYAPALTIGQLPIDFKDANGDGHEDAFIGNGLAASGPDPDGVELQYFDPVLFSFFGTPSHISTCDIIYNSGIAGDFNGDGIVDHLYVGNDPWYGNHIRFSSGVSFGGLGAPVRYPMSTTSGDIRLLEMDADNDGDTDAMVLNREQVWLLVNTGDSIPALLPIGDLLPDALTTFSQVDARDLDQDGFPEVYFFGNDPNASVINVLDNLGQWCPVPDSLVSTELGGGSFRLSWGYVPGADEYQVEIKEASGPVFATPITTDTSVVVTSLLPGITYEWSVQAVCSSLSSVTSSLETIALASSTGIAMDNGAFEASSAGIFMVADVLGRVLLKERIEPGQSIPTPHLPTGTYVAVFLEDTGHRTQMRWTVAGH